MAYSLKLSNVHCLYILVKMENQHVQIVYIWGGGQFYNTRKFLTKVTKNRQKSVDLVCQFFVNLDVLT